MVKIDNQVTTQDGYWQLPEISAPATPPSGSGRLYSKTDGKIYFKEDAGVEYDLTSVSSVPGYAMYNLTTSQTINTTEYVTVWDTSPLHSYNNSAVTSGGTTFTLTAGYWGVSVVLGISSVGSTDSAGFDLRDDGADRIDGFFTLLYAVTNTTSDKVYPPILRSAIDARGGTKTVRVYAFSASGSTTLVTGTTSIVFSRIA